MNPPFHPPSVCPSANLSPFHLPHTETRQWGPHPSSVFEEISALPGALISHWGTRFCICTSFPNLFIIYCTNAFIFSYLLLSSLLATCFPFGHTQPMSPLVGALLLIYPRRHRLYLQSTTQVTYHLSSEFVHLVPPLAQLIPDLVVPLTLDLVTRLRPRLISYTLQPRAVWSLPTS
jgi:hypothetical protein